MRAVPLAPLALAVMALLHGAPSTAGTGDGQFGVHIALSPAGSGTPAVPALAAPASSLGVAPRSGLCRSRTLSEATGASVEVTCRSGQFVSITPQPGAPFLGVHGGAFRYAMSFRTELSFWDERVDPALGWATVTALRLYEIAPADAPADPAWERPLEMLVRF